MSEAAKNTCNYNSNNSDAGPPQLAVVLPSREDVTTTSRDQPDLPVDVLLVTIKDCEFLACYNELKDRYPYRYHFDDLGYVYFADVVGSQQGKVKVALMQCHEGAIGPGGSLIAVKNAAPILQPKAVFNVGLCSGLNPNKTRLGDVIVSAKLTTYAPKVMTSNQEQWAGMRSYVSRRFLNIITNCADGWHAPLKNAKDRHIEVHCNGEFLSGPEQIRAKERRVELFDRFPLALGVEMEGEGVFTAAFDTQLEWLIVKGIADYADGEQASAKSWETCASVMAASLVSHILSDPKVFRTWPNHPVHNLIENLFESGRKRKLTEHDADSATTAPGRTLEGLKEMPSVLLNLMRPVATVPNLAAGKTPDKDNNGKECQPAENKDSNSLHSAAEGGNVSIIEMVLSEGFEVNSKDSFGITPLMVAACKGKKQAVDFLLCNGADPSMTDNTGRNLLHAAVIGGDVSIVETLVNHVPVDLSAHGVTPLMIAVFFNNLESTEFLLRKGADPSKTFHHGRNVLFLSVQFSGIDILQRLLSYGVDINSKDDEGCTPLMWAAACAKLQAVNCLLEEGADPSLTANNGWNVLHCASQGGNTTIIETILSKGIDVNIDTYIGLTPLMVAIKNKNLEAIQYLLEKGADPLVETRLIRINSLLLAIYEHSASTDLCMIEAMLSSELDINAQSRSDGWTALMCAAFIKQREVFDFLLRKGADLSLKDNDGRTVLHHASEGGDISIIKQCLSCGLDIESEDNDGKTALDLAASGGNGDAFRFLRERRSIKNS